MVDTVPVIDVSALCSPNLPDRRAVAGALDAACCGPGDPPSWPPVTGAAYPRERLDATYAQRRDPGG